MVSDLKTIELLRRHGSNRRTDETRYAVPPQRRYACDVEFIEDGMAFASSSVEAIRIKEGAEYEGIRISFSGSLGKARISMQIDVGFGGPLHRCCWEMSRRAVS